ncbi:MAG: hypothetical protein U0441_22780 [Polyangiaceae bacterium]
MDKKPSISRMVMFKHGVAYLERSGPAAGSFELSFRIGDMNDVLKSLAVWVADGDAKLLSVGFDAPEDPDVALAQRGLLLGPGTALDTMLKSLRGRAIEVEEGAVARRGEVLGVQDTTGPQGETRRALLLRTAPDAVAMVDVAQIRGLRLLEEVSRDRLDFTVSRSQAATAGETRAVRVALAGKARDLRVAYVVPAPVWRVSYRVVRDKDTAMLMALAIVHNPVDEDVSDVDLTLTTGQPVSFVIDLYHPKNVARAVVEEQSRAAAPPTRFAVGAAPPPPAPPGFGPPPAMGGFGPPPAPAYSAPLREELMMDSFGAAAEGASEGVTRGELFEYHVATRISIPRGGSAMVPIAAASVPARRERIWRQGSGTNPDVVLTFDNGTGLVLEEGPAVIYDEGVYAGESMLPYSARGVPVRMGFAKDLAVRVHSHARVETITARLTPTQTGMYEEQRQETTTTVEAENDHDEAVELTVELPRNPNQTIAADSPQPVEETASHRRFVFTVPAHGKGALEVREILPLYRTYQYDALATGALEVWLQGRFLDAATFDALKGILGHYRRARELDLKAKQAVTDRDQAYTKQSKISEQLRVLKDTGPEGDLRLRYVTELAAEQDRVNQAEAEWKRLQAEIEAEKRAANEEIAALAR